MKVKGIIFLLKKLSLSLSSNDHKRMKSIYSIKTYAYRASKFLVSGKEEIKWKNITKRYKND